LGPSVAVGCAPPYMRLFAPEQALQRP
jgi:hypothetical protein